MSKLLLPTEIQVWYMIPFIRKELTRVMVKDFKLNQKKTAELIKITPAAVSQYLKDKRGNNNFKITTELKKEIKKSAKLIIDKKSTILEQTMYLLQSNIIKKMICKYHKKEDNEIKKDCNICFQQENLI